GQCFFFPATVFFCQLTLLTEIQKRLIFSTMLISSLRLPFSSGGDNSVIIPFAFRRAGVFCLHSTAAIAVLHCQTVDSATRTFLSLGNRIVLTLPIHDKLFWRS